jgi:hypothetical protein
MQTLREGYLTVEKAFQAPHPNILRRLLRDSGLYALRPPPRGAGVFTAEQAFCVSGYGLR